MSREHANAVLALAQAVPNLTAYDTFAAAKPPYPYAVLTFDSAPADRTSIAAVSNMATSTFTVKAVGVDRGSAQAVAEREAAALVDVRPVVAGRTCSPIEWLSSSGMQRDDSLSPPLFYAVDVYRFVSVT